MHNLNIQFEWNCEAGLVSEILVDRIKKHAEIENSYGSM